MQENGKDSRKVVRDAQWNGGNLCENHKTISEKQEGTKKNRKENRKAEKQGSRKTGKQKSRKEKTKCRGRHLVCRPRFYCAELGEGNALALIELPVT